MQIIKLPRRIDVCYMRDILQFRSKSLNVHQCFWTRLYACIYYGWRNYWENVFLYFIGRLWRFFWEEEEEKEEKGRGVIFEMKRAATRPESAIDPLWSFRWYR